MLVISVQWLNWHNFRKSSSPACLYKGEKPDTWLLHLRPAPGTHLCMVALIIRVEAWFNISRWPSLSLGMIYWCPPVAQGPACASPSWPAPGPWLCTPAATGPCCPPLQLWWSQGVHELRSLHNKTSEHCEYTGEIWTILNRFPPITLLQISHIGSESYLWGWTPSLQWS